MRTLVGATLAALAAATPASAALPTGAAVGGIVYTVEAHSGSLAASCTVVADRWTADYGPTHVTAVAVSPFGIDTTVRCTVEKNGTTYVSTEARGGDPVVSVVNERNGTIPVVGVRVCVWAESQLSIDARPVASSCIDG